MEVYVNYIFELQKDKDEKRNISRLEITVEDNIEKCFKITKCINTILIVTFLCMVVIGILISLIWVSCILFDYSCFIIENITDITLAVLIIADICLIFFNDSNIVYFYSELMEISKDNASINFNTEMISYRDKNERLHEIHIPKDDEIKYWDKDYIKINVKKNKLEKYYPMEYRKDIKKAYKLKSK